MPKISSVSAFFPAYNDAGTIASMVVAVVRTLQDLTDDYEVIVVNDGSVDYTAEVLDELSRIYSQMRVIHHEGNKGYGAALRTGFAAARKEWLFYTDGDAQYDPHELTKLVDGLGDQVDIVNGYKIARNDPLHRVIIGKLYHFLMRIAFGFRLRDVDCDFRLIRRRILDEVPLESTSGTICVEMVTKFEHLGYHFAEVPVHHYHRSYGKSQFFAFPRLFRTGVQLIRLWWKLVIRKDYQ